MIAPQVSGFIQSLFYGAERGRAFGLFGATIGLSTAIGPVLGGLLVQVGGTDFGWRLVFYVNLPIGIAVLLLVRKLLPRTEPGPKQSVDPVGVGLFAVSMLLVLLPLVGSGESQPLSRRPWWLLAVAAAMLVLFGLWERHWDRTGRETLVDLSLRKVRSYLLGLGLGTAYFAGFTSIFLVVTLYLQTGLHYDPLQAGLTQVPFAVGSAGAAWLGGRLVSRFGRPLVVLGLVTVVVGLAGVDLVVAHVHTDGGLRLRRCC